MAENLSERFSNTPGLYCDYYHGGKSIKIIENVLSGGIPKPFMIFMTIAGGSSLNVPGLDTVVIVDEMYKERVRSGGVFVLERDVLGTNELLQMGGRVNGRVPDGLIFILTNRGIDFHKLQPTVPEFVLGGDLRQLALICARVEVDLSGLELISRVSLRGYQREVRRFQERGLINSSGCLTSYGKLVEKLPVDPSWAEMIVHATEQKVEDFLTMIIMMSCTQSLRDLIDPKEAKLELVRVVGSDHLTSYNIVSFVLKQFAYLNTDENGVTVYKLRDDFTGWCKNNGFVERAIIDVLIAMKSVFYQMGLDLPETNRFVFVWESSRLSKMFRELLAKVHSFELVHGIVDGKGKNRFGVVFRAKHSVTVDGVVLGIVRLIDFGDGVSAIVEGTDVSSNAFQRYSTRRGKGVFFAGEILSQNKKTRGGKSPTRTRLRSRSGKKTKGCRRR